MVTETDLQREIIKALERAGYWAFRVNSGTFRGAGGYSRGAPSGTPDICVVWPPGWLEVKLPRGKLRPDQDAWGVRARALGVNHRVVTGIAEAVEVVRGWEP